VKSAEKKREENENAIFRNAFSRPRKTDSSCPAVFGSRQVFVLRIGVDISFEKVRVFTQASTATARYYALDICIEIRSAIPKISKIVTDASLDLPEKFGKPTGDSKDKKMDPNEISVQSGMVERRGAVNRQVTRSTSPTERVKLRNSRSTSKR
jgi:hypothetical protein